ncbi:glycine--tRNA ligase [Candidatus Dependentiae bacterium]|nr:glycine--tRNA ligase [Candidatus Dependentiae bacterium]
MTTATSPVTLEKIVALCKRRGFVYQTADIYGGLNGVYDTGPLGTLMKQNIRAAWTNSLKIPGQEMLFIEGSLISPQAVWEASGHISGFQDPMVDCLSCKHRYRADDIDLTKACSFCGNLSWTPIRQFNLMFKTQVGAAEDASSVAYLRPETAQSIFINFKNIMASNRVKIPFGVAQIGKAFRNEITPKQFLFRMREFEQMEMEWFCPESSAMEYFELWSAKRKKFYAAIGIKEEHIRIRPHEADELSHYSSATSDIEYLFPFGWKELEGVAYRGNYDLSKHMEFSGKDLSVYDEQEKTSFIPHVVECSVGTDRLFLTLLFEAYHEDIVGGETRILLKLHPTIAPFKAAFMPLSKQQLEPMEKICLAMKDKGLTVQFDATGSIGKRYRRQDEIGTPLCFTYDFDSESTGTVTVRNRDTTAQERISIDTIEEYIRNTLRA